MHRKEHTSLAPPTAYVPRSCHVEPKTTVGSRDQNRRYTPSQRNAPAMVLQTWHRRWLSWHWGGRSRSSLYTVAGSTRGSARGWPILRFSLPRETPAAGLKPGFPLARQVLYPPGRQLSRCYPGTTGPLQQACETTLPFYSPHHSEA